MVHMPFGLMVLGNVSMMILTKLKSDVQLVHSMIVMTIFATDAQLQQPYFGQPKKQEIMTISAEEMTTKNISNSQNQLHTSLLKQTDIDL